MPLSHASADASGSGGPTHVNALLEERDSRISSLEGELRNMQEDLSNMTRLIYTGSAPSGPLPSPLGQSINPLARKSSLSRSVGQVRSPTTPLHPLSNDATAYYTHGRSGSSQWRSNNLDSPRTPASGASSPHLPTHALLATGHPDMGQVSTPAAPAFSFAVSGSNDHSASAKTLKNQLSTASLRSIGSNATVTPNGVAGTGLTLPEEPVSPRSMTAPSATTPRPASPTSSSLPPSLPRPIAVPSLSQAISPALLSLPTELAPVPADAGVGSPGMPSLPSPAPTPTSSAPPPLGLPPIAADIDGSPVDGAVKASPPTERTPSSSKGKTPSSSARAGSSSSKAVAAGADRNSPFPKSFRVTIEDPCWKVLPAVLKKYRLDDDPKKYVLFLCYASEGAFWSCPSWH